LARSLEGVSSNGKMAQIRLTDFLKMAQIRLTDFLRPIFSPIFSKTSAQPVPNLTMVPE